MKLSARTLVAVLAVLATLLALVGSASAVQDPPIPPGGSTILPDYVGAPANAHPLSNTGSPQNPYMAPNPYSHPHNDTSGSTAGC